MKTSSKTTAAVLITMCLTPTAALADSEHLRQLLATKQCQNCDLSSAGLVLSNLSGAILSGANLTGANLSRANLSGADLSGADLSGASLFGANLSGAKLNGANLSGADLRDTYLLNADFTNVNLNGASLQGAAGIPAQIVTAKDYYRWGMVQGQKGDPQGAIAYFNHALNLNPNYAPAYLARGVARYQMFDRPGAIKDAQVAEKLFYAQGDAQGYQTAQTFVKELSTLPKDSIPKSKPNFMNFLGGVASFLLRTLIPF